MRKVIVIGFVPLLATVLLAQGPPRGGGFGFGRPEIVGAGPGSRTPVTGEPYSGVETRSTQQSLANGNTISHKSQISVARDGQGRMSTTETVTPPASSGKPAYTVETIFDPVAGFRYMLNSSTMVAVQSPLPKPPSGAPTHTRTPPANPNVTTASLGTSTINGVLATGTQVTDNIPAGAIGNAQAIQVVRMTWIATALQIPVEIKTSDPRFGSTDMELTNIVQGEPSSSLFVVPAGYTVQKGGRGAGGRGHGGPGGPGGPGGGPGPAGFRRGGPPQQ